MEKPQPPQDEPKKRVRSEGRLGYLFTEAEISQSLADRLRSAHGLPHESNTTPIEPPADDPTSILRRKLKESRKPQK